MTMLAEPPRVKAKAKSRGSSLRVWTSDEFLDWLEEDVQAELIAGQIIMHSPVSLNHAFLLNFVDRLLAGYIGRKQLGHLFREVVAVKLDQRFTFLPDLCFFTNEQVAKLLPNHAEFAPTLVVECLSPRTAKRDTGVKFAAYERAGVLEYWILDPLKEQHRFYTREGELLTEFAASEQRVESRVVPGFYLRREWLATPETRDGLECLREVLGGSL